MIEQRSQGTLSFHAASLYSGENRDSGAATQKCWEVGLSVEAKARQLKTSRDDACIEAGVSFVLYDCRHTFATRFAAAHPDPYALAASLGILAFGAS